MIYNIQTFCTYGYWPDTDLTRKSGKPIIAACDRCGTIRVTSKHAYRDLCVTCATKKRFEDPLEREKTGNGVKKFYFDNPEAHEEATKRGIKRFEDPLEREKNGKAVKQAYINDLTIVQRQSDSQKQAYINDPTLRQRKSEAGRKHYTEMDDPGLEIVGHHIAYDFNRPEAFIIKITRRFHGQIHKPKGTPFTERGYSLID